MKNNSKKIYFILVILVLIVIVSVLIFYTVQNKQLKLESNTLVASQINQTYKNPYVPTGFKTVDTNGAKWVWENNQCVNWDEGLVIEDESNGNQFVWVPVDGVNVKSSELYGSGQVKIEIEEAIKDQMDQFGGFYISRYEAGVPDSVRSGNQPISIETNNVAGVPVSKQGAIPWNYISADQADANAKKMYKNNDIFSTLIPESCWNMTMQWLRQAGYDVDQNSGDFGNYSDTYFNFSGFYSDDYGVTYIEGDDVAKEDKNIILQAGATERNRSKNIYDLAGNLQEYVRSEKGFASYGGHYDNTSHSVANSGHALNKPNDLQGFRVVLLKNNE